MGVVDSDMVPSLSLGLERDDQQQVTRPEEDQRVQTPQTIVHVVLLQTTSLV